MANLPAKRPQSTEPVAKQELLETLAEHMAEGKRPTDLAKRLAPKDRAKQKSLRVRIRRLVWYEPRLQELLALHAKGEMLMALPQAGQALGRKSKAGRVDAMKLLFEVTGLHNPRVSHEHSGEVNIKVTMPRPDFKSTQDDTPVVDAEVVDEP